MIDLDEGSTSKDRISYAYAGNEFRPLIITDNGGIAGPVQPQTNKQQPTSYEEVEIHCGKFDRANVDINQLMPSPEYENINYSHEESSSQTTQSTTLDDGGNTEDVYATVNKDRQKKTKETEQPPEIPSRKDITRSDLYEHITGQLQTMIEACDDKKAPPALPKPYSGPGIAAETYNNDNNNDRGMLIISIIKNRNIEYVLEHALQCL